ncbi:hypothetical protein BLNAU_7148 [Blattamonas nauphoetae]|uniref:Uncharacterized protein n=1 Tax=Blattamonas nauphoetae TaxID=2049346 RepID=A0ABQ9Y2L2_9EUKA|nr:hypothetical protein BLNAU_7148 [Blattamonas nauphoetae]
MSKPALKALSTRCKSDSATRSFLRTLKVPSGSTDRSSELVPFAGRLCGVIAEHVSVMKTLFTESSPTDATISALSTSLPEESPWLSGNTLLEVLCEEFSLLTSMLISWDDAFRSLLINCDFVSLVKSTIIASLDLIEHERSESIAPPSDRAALLIKILDSSWDGAASCVSEDCELLRPVVESAFSDVPQLCSLLERTCRLSSPTHSSHLQMIISITVDYRRLIHRMLEDNLFQRVLDTSQPMAVPTIHHTFHLNLIWAIGNPLWDQKDIIKDKEELKRLRKMQFERVSKPAKQYLQFILQRDEFAPNDDTNNKDLQIQIVFLLQQTLKLERDLFKDGVIVETGREEWEVGWLVEKTTTNDLKERLMDITKDDRKMMAEEMKRWKQREERLRQAGHEDAVDAWMKREIQPSTEIAEYLRSVTKERGVNCRF